MTIFFSTNIPEFRSIIQLNRSSKRIADISQRLETGQRINSGKDDPEGLIVRDRLRADMKGLYAAKENAARADNMLSVADSGLASLSKFLLGNTDDGTTGLKALVGSVASNSADADALKAKISQTLDMMNGVTRATTYGGKQLLNGDLAYKTRFSGDDAKLANLNISKANGGNQSVKVEVVSAASQTAKTLTALTDPLAGTQVGDSLTVRVNGTDYKYTVSESDLDPTSYSPTTQTGNLMNSTLYSKLDDLLKGTGVNLNLNAGVLTFTAAKYGSDQTLSITADGNGALGAVAEDTSASVDGADAVVKVNGNVARVNGTHVSYTDPSGDLAFETDVANVAGKNSEFNIVSGGATFQLGKNVLADQQLKFGLSSASTATLGGSTGKLNDLLSLDFTNAADVKKASAIVDEAIDNINAKRGQIGFMQGNVLKPMSEYIEDDLTSVTTAEGTISNVDTALESSRLAREQLLANNAMNAALFNRSYAQFLISSLWS